MTNTATIGSRVLWPWVRAVRSLGMDPVPELKGVGLREDQLRDPAERIPYGAAQALVETLVRFTGRRDLGLLAAAEVESGHFELLELAVRSARTLGSAIEHLVRFFPLLDNGGVLRFERGAPLSKIAYQAAGLQEVHPAYAEYLPAMLLLAARRETGVDSQGLRGDVVYFRHPPPGDTAAYERLFACPVVFGAPTTVALLYTADLELPFLRANARTHQGAIAAISEWFLKAAPWRVEDTVGGGPSWRGGKDENL